MEITCSTAEGKNRQALLAETAPLDVTLLQQPAARILPNTDPVHHLVATGNEQTAQSST